MKKENILNVVLLVTVGVLVVVSTVKAATTISTNIVTEGTLSVTGTTTLMGNVGMGTSSPSRALSVVGNSWISGALFNNDGTGVSMVSVGSTSYTYLGGGNSACNGCGSDGAGIGVLGNASFFPGSIDAFIAPASKVAANADPVFSVSIADTFVPLISAYTKGVRILLDKSGVGSVGVGATTTPYARFSIVGSSVSSTTVAIKPATSQVANILDIYNISGVLESVMKANGNLGIGTTTPATKLHVSSGVSATTTITIGELGLSSSKSCVNMNRADGGAGSFYISAAGTLVVESNYCR